MPENDSNERKPVLGLSATQLVGGSAAAATAAVLGSRLGVAGTVVGAAAASLISAVAGSLYTQSLRRTREMIRARDLLKSRDVMARAGRTRSQAAIRKVPGADTEQIEEAVEEATPSIWRRVTWKTVALTAAVFFVITTLVVTGTELLTGKSLDGSSRTTVTDVFQGGPPRPRDGTPTKSPAPQPSETPTGSTTPSALPGTSTPTPTQTPTSTPTPTPSPNDLPTASAPPTPSGTPTP